ncbi:aldehyde dehydrogenase family 2 member C4-like protein [Tanacetum coccineum]
MSELSGDKEDIDLGVKAAREAFDHGPWPHLSGSERGRIMMKFLQLAEENIEELATLDALNAGKLFELGKAAEIPFAFSVLRYYAGAVDKIHGNTLRMANQLQGHTLHEPIGFGETTGAAIGSHMDIDCVSFTGSTEIGRVVMQAAATSNLKAVSLEQCS